VEEKDVRTNEGNCFSFPLYVNRSTPLQFAEKEALMHRIYVWKSAPALLLLVCVPVVWSQTFGVNVIGTANACGEQRKYSQDGGNSASGDNESICKKEGAQAASKVALDSTADGALILAGESSGYATSLAYDTVTLIPPSKFNGNIVGFTLIDDYQTLVANGGGTGSIRLCWNIPGLWKRCITEAHAIQVNVSKKLTLQKSSGGFQFEVTKIASVRGSSSAKHAWDGGYITLGTPNFELPRGWKCTYASGGECGAELHQAKP
jgi:hypothetical protein